MVNPTLVEVRRGPVIESFHRGAVAVIDADGGRVFVLGEVDSPILPRSAIKALQALPLIEAGATELLGFGDKELALACSSHGGEAPHVAVAAEMLARVGKSSAALECGAHWPTDQESAFELARRGAAPLPLHNQCSGKHAGFICLAHLMSVNHASYVEADHPVQRAVAGVIESLTGYRLAAGGHAVDGCSAPTWPIPLVSLALAFARFGAGTGLGPARAKAATRLRAACAAQASYVGSAARLCANAMRLLGERAFMKFGVEGVYCGALPSQGIGIAIKMDDGAVRAAEVVMASLLRRFLELDDLTDNALTQFAEPAVVTWSGKEVGGLRPAPVFSRIR